jgi:hypothetical protein
VRSGVQPRARFPWQSKAGPRAFTRLAFRSSCAIVDPPRCESDERRVQAVVAAVVAAVGTAPSTSFNESAVGILAPIGPEAKRHMDTSADSIGRPT